MNFNFPLLFTFKCVADTWEWLSLHGDRARLQEWWKINMIFIFFEVDRGEKNHRPRTRSWTRTISVRFRLLHFLPSRATLEFKIFTFFNWNTSCDRFSFSFVSSFEFWRKQNDGFEVGAKNKIYRGLMNLSRALVCLPFTGDSKVSFNVSFSLDCYSKQSPKQSDTFSR